MTWSICLKRPSWPVFPAEYRAAFLEVLWAESSEEF